MLLLLLLFIAFLIFILILIKKLRGKGSFEKKKLFRFINIKVCYIIARERK